MRFSNSLRASVCATAVLSATTVFALEEEAVEMAAVEGVQTIEMIGTPDEEVAEIPSKSFLFNTETAATFVIETTSDTPFQIYVDGSLVASVPGADVAQAIETLVSLSPGEHLITIEGEGVTDELIDQIRMGQAGEELAALRDFVTGPAPEGLDRRRFADKMRGVGFENGLPRRGGIGMGDGITPFTIGGSSSTNQRMGGGASGENMAGLPGNGGMAGNGAAGGTPGFGGGAGGSAGGGVSMAGGTGTTGETSGSGGSTGGGISVGGSGGGGNSGGGSGGGGNSGGGSAPAPAPNPAPTPNPAPPQAPTPTIPPGTVVPPDTPAAPVAAGQSVSSPLAPPSTFEPTVAVQLSSGGTEENVVSSSGQTLFGAVMDPQAFDIVTATIMPSNRTTIVDVGPTTGQFAVRLFPEDMGNNMSVTLTAGNSSNTEVTSTPVNYSFTNAVPQDGLAQALGRVSFGATPSLYARVRAMGFNNYIEEQLAPEAINDGAFESANLDDNLLPGANEGNSNDIREGTMEYELANAVFSEKQLQEIMGNFWSNHFHANNKNSSIVRNFMTDREFFRQNAFGRFEDLLLYSARSPLMSQYLDNDTSRAGNINENYGREILELHTVGVDGGYNDDDVIAVSRIFTGWRYERTDNRGQVDSAQQVWEFLFEPDRHDTDAKDIPFLSTTIAGRAGAAGVQEGEELIAILASDPRTQRFVCGKIVQKFVGDNPPANIVQACVDAWSSSNGMTRDILRAVLTHPDFVTSVANQRSVAKNPFEYTASYMRAVGAEPVADGESDFFRRFRESVYDAGWVPYFFPAPTGMPEVSAAWLSSATLVAQYNKLSEVAERAERYGIDLQEDITDAGLETAEEVAAYILSTATADRFQRDEFEAMVATLKGEDGIFEPMVADEKAALDRAAGLLLVLSSFHLQ